MRRAMFSEPLVAHRALAVGAGAPRDAHGNARHDHEERRDRAKQNQHGTRLAHLEVEVTS